MSHSHAIVWMDSREAHVFRFSADDVERQRIRSHSPFRKIHHKAGVIGAGHVHLDHGYFEEIAEALDGIQEWLLTGPKIYQRARFDLTYGSAAAFILLVVTMALYALQLRLVGTRRVTGGV